MNSPLTHSISDPVLWDDVLRGNSKAYETIVSRYQNLLCSIAYSKCGDFSLSEDLAQEAFWAAWESRESLREPDRLRNWLCGIVRNLALSHQRKKDSRPTGISVGESTVSDDPGVDPALVAITREEQNLVWKSLQEIPENYREPLVLFYREEQSIAEVADALDLSEDAVKQRLSRGRAMLRDRVASLVEGALHRSRPTTSFTMAVMAGMTASAGSKFALAGGSTVAATSTTTATLATVGKVTLGGVLSGICGSALGVFGGYLGFSIPALFAPTRRERDYLVSVGKRTVLVSIGFVVAIAIGLTLLERHDIGLFVLCWNVLLTIYVLMECLVAQRQVHRIRATTTPESDPNPSSASHWMMLQSGRWEKRHYCSPWRLLGIPLLHINAKPNLEAPSHQIPWTTGWIAIGDKAQGVIAMGGVARGGVACGGMAYGAVAIGGVALGLMSLGGLSIGGLALGGAALGVKAFGGLAVASKLAAGGRVYSLESGVGASVSSLHANDETARNALAHETLLMDLIQWAQRHPVWPILIVVLVPQLLIAAMYMVSYRRKRIADTSPQREMT